MDAVGRSWVLALSRPAVPNLTMVSAREIVATLAASAAMALLVALAGNYLPDLPTASTSQAEQPATPPPSALLFCAVVAEERRCIEEAS